MKYQTTTYENFGVIKEVSRLQGKFEVVGHKEVLEFVQERRPHLVSFDGQRAYTSRPEALAEYVYKIKGSFNKYRLLFIPA